MRLPPVRITVRTSLVAVAVLAAVLGSVNWTKGDNRRFDW
jgi:hypothetical protein